MLNVNLKDRNLNTIIRQSTRVMDLAEYVTNVRWNGLDTLPEWKTMYRWTIRSTEWQIKGVRLVGRPKHCLRDNIVWQQGMVWSRTAKDRERTLVECSFLQWLVCLPVACIMSQQHASFSQGWICSDNCTCCNTETEVADQTFYLTQSQYTDTRPTGPNADPITPGAWQGSHWSANFYVTGMTWPGKIPIQALDLLLLRWTP